MHQEVRNPGPVLRTAESLDPSLSANSVEPNAQKPPKSTLHRVDFGDLCIDARTSDRLLPAIPTTLAGTGYEANQPEYEQDHCDPPERVYGESEASQYQRKREYDNDDSHDEAPVERRLL